MQQHERYDRDNETRAAVTSALKEFGYAVEAWTVADKIADDERTVTIKASRNLRVEQTEFDLGGGGRSATIDGEAVERLRSGSGVL